MDIKHIIQDETEEFHTEERCYILELLNHSDDPSQSIARARVEPEVTTAWHRLKNTTESFYILKGIGRAEVGEENFHDLKAGDLLRIPPNTPQRITNNGEEDLVFLCFCTPAFNAEIYESLE